MRRLIGLFGVSLGLALPSCVFGQSLAVDSSAVAERAVSILLVPPPRLPESPLEAWTGEGLLPDGARLVLARQRRQRTPEETIITTGAIIGMAAGAAYAFHDARHGALGYLGGVFLAPFGMLAGGVVGTGAGLVVCLVVCPPHR